MSFLFLALYFYIFAPPFRFIPFGVDKIILLIALTYITQKRKWKFFLNLFKSEYWLLLLIFLYSLMRGILGGDKIYTSYDFLLLIEVLTVPFFFFLLLDIEDSCMQLDKMMVICAIVASFISLYLLVDQQSAIYFKTVLLKYPEELIERFSFRGFGFSDGLFFGYPVVLGFCGGLIVLGVFRSNYSILFILPLVISIFSNARSGLIPIVLSIVIALFYNTKSLTKKGIILFGTIFIFSGFVVILLDQNETIKTSFQWGMTSFEIAGDFFNGHKSENVDVLLNDMLIFPNSLIEWVFGSGKFLFGANVNETDIGYLLRLNYGGIIYCFLFFLLTVYMFLRLIYLNKAVALLLFASLIYLHLKSDFFIVNPSSRFFFFIYCICVGNRKYFNML